MSTTEVKSNSAAGVKKALIIYYSWGGNARGVAKEIATLPHAAISEVVDFIRLIKLKFPEEDGVSGKKSLFGVWKNEPFYMSPDFDAPLEDFSEYL